MSNNYMPMFEKIFTFTTAVSMFIGGFFSAPIAESPQHHAEESNNTEEVQFGDFAPVAGGTYRLQTSIGTTDTTIRLSSFTEPISGAELTMSSLNTDIAYGTLDPQSSTRKEFVSFTGITQNADGTATLTGVTRGLGFTYPFTASSTLRKAHPGQSIFILSDSPQFFNEYARRRADETITGQWTFDVFPITASSSFASATTSGWVELATGAEAASSTLIGNISDSRLALGTDISTSTAPVSGNVIPVTQSDGTLDDGFLTKAAPIGSVTAYASSTAPTGWLTADGSAVSRTTYADLFAVIGTTWGTGDGSTTFNLPNLESSVIVGSGQRTETFSFDDADVNTTTDVITVLENDYLYTGQAVALSNSGGALPTGLSATTYYVIRVSDTVVKLAASVAGANAGVAVDITAAAGGGTHTLTLTLTDRSLGDQGGEETHALTDAEMPSHNHGIDGAGGLSNDVVVEMDDPDAGGSSGADDGFADDAFESNGGDAPHNNMPPYVVMRYIIKY